MRETKPEIHEAVVGSLVSGEAIIVKKGANEALLLLMFSKMLLRSCCTL